MDKQRELISYRDMLRIEAGGTVEAYGNVQEDWQKADLDAMTPAFLKLMGYSKDECVQRFMIERPRGHSKTTDQAILACWSLCFALTPIHIVVAASDKDQAKLIRDAINTLVRLNPILDYRKKLDEKKHGMKRGILKVNAFDVTNVASGATLEILAADAAGSWGLQPSLCICDELTVWPEGRGEQLWESLFSAVAKRDEGVIVVISNAGWQASWQGELRAKIIEDPDWHHSTLEGPQASWISDKKLAEQKRILPKQSYERVWENKWIEGSGDALAPELVDQAVTLSGPTPFPEPGWLYVAGLDLGVRKDASALAVVGIDVGWVEEVEPDERPPLMPDQLAAIDAGLMDKPASMESQIIHHPPSGKMRLCELQTWQAGKGQRLDLEKVEAGVIETHQRFGFGLLCVDPWQSEMMVSRMIKQGVPAELVFFTGGNLKGMASAVTEAFNQKLIELYEDPMLVKALKALKVVVSSTTWRLDYHADSKAVGDTATGLALALFAARRFEWGKAAPVQHVQRELVMYPN